jgi:hypothetical protein
MKNRAKRLLDFFAEAANRRALDADDWTRFYEFVIFAHQQGVGMNNADIIVQLRNAGFPSDLAIRLGSEYTHYLGLLSLYDKRQSKVPTGCGPLA